jgi:hypothetical protein
MREGVEQLLGADVITTAITGGTTKGTKEGGAGTTTTGRVRRRDGKRDERRCVVNRAHSLCETKKNRKYGLSA